MSVPFDDLAAHVSLADVYESPAFDLAYIAPTRSLHFCESYRCCVGIALLFSQWHVSNLGTLL